MGSLGRTQDSNWVIALGSSKGCWIKTTTTGVHDSGDDTNQFAIISNTNIADITDVAEKTDEGGATYSLDSIRNAKFTFTHIQRDTDQLNMMISDLRGSYATIVKTMYKSAVSGQYQVLIIPIAKPTSDLKLDLPGGEPQTEWTAQPLTVAFSIDLNTMNDPVGDLSAELLGFSLTLGTTVVTFAIDDLWTILDVTGS